MNLTFGSPGMPALAGLAACLLVSCSCGPGTAVVSGVIDEYLQAVQVEDLEKLYCLSAGASESGRSGFQGWARGEYDAYYGGRDEGWVDLSRSPIVLAKAFTLGKGTFYSTGYVRDAADNAVEIDMTVRFAYGEINIGGLSPGTTFYVCGEPVGTIHPVMIPRRPGTEEKEVLESVTVRWTLVYQEESDECPESWAVHSAEIVPGSETSTRVVWIF